MNILNFPPPKQMPDGWQYAEVQKLIASSAMSLTSGEAGGWDVGSTDAGDPQLYLLGPAPDYDCILCVSRLGRLYVLEDGHGRILFENRNLELLIPRIRAALSRKKMMVFAKAAIAWATVRQVIEERIEPLMAEPIEIVTHFAPQLAALA